MSTFLRVTASAVYPFALLLNVSAWEAGAPQAPAETRELPVSLERIRRELEKPAPRMKPSVRLDYPVAVFRTSVEQRSYMLSFEDWLKKELALTDLQRQSADWAGMCCGGYGLASGAAGVRLDPLFTKLDDVLERRKVRKINKEIDRELAALEAARKKGEPIKDER